MKRILSSLFALLAFSLLMFIGGCTKDQLQDHQIDVSFNINLVAQGGELKSTASQSTISAGLKADYVRAIINNEEYIMNVLYLGDMPYTNTIKLPKGNYIMSEFIVYSDNNNTNSNDDVVLAATPHSGSDFTGYVQRSLNYNLTVSGYNKLGLPIDVVGYEPKDYNHFGFTYF